MKILIFTKNETQFIKKRLVDEAKKRNHQVTLANYEELRFSLGDKFGIFVLGRELTDNHDAVILRMAPGGVMVYYKDLLARHFGQNSFVVNGASFIKWPFLGKITQNFLLSQAGLPVVESQIFARKGRLQKTNLEYPVIAKKHFGRLGNSVFKAQSQSELVEILGDSVQEYLIQPFLPTGEDYRVIVLGGKALPKVMKKVAPAGQLVTNISQGGIAVAENITDELRRLSEGAAKVFEADYAGVDIMYDVDGKPHILEINRSANFSGFEESTGINVAKLIIEMIEKINE